MKQVLRLSVLGGFAAHWPDGTPAKLTTRKAQALLGYLAVENARTHNREQLATLLWADSGDDRARHNLRQALAKIRQLCDALITASDDCLAINKRVCSVDAIEFESLAQSTEPEDWRRCLELYRGDLLAGVAPRAAGYDDWLVPARNRLRNLACRVGARLAETLREQGRVDDAIATLKATLEIDPAYEPAHTKLMELLAQSGRRSEALRQYQYCVEALERELGARPGAAISALYARLSDSDATPSAASQPPSQFKTDLPTVAVLPFENLSNEQDDYFVDGIAEDLITALSRFGSLVVIARRSSFEFRDSGLDDHALADRLGAQFLVHGSVRRAEQRVRINVQLVDANAGRQLWGERFDREAEDLFALEDEITATLVSTLAGRVEAERLAHARRAPIERLDAYDYLLRGKDLHHRFTAEDCSNCITMFESAIERDPRYALAYAWLACGLGQAMVFELDDINSLTDRCEAASNQGLELDQNESECHRVLAQVNLTRGNVQRALSHQERSLALNPNHDESICSMGEILTYAGRAREGEGWIRRSMQLNPYHPARYWTHLARSLFHQGRFSDALMALDRISHAREDELAYRIAASVRVGDEASLAQNVSELRRRWPGFDATGFAQGLPYTKEEDRQALLAPLIAGLDQVA